MTLKKESIEWAIDVLCEHSDGDIFPKILELSAIQEMKEDFIGQIEGVPLAQFNPKPCRRFIVPKDEISYRQATQLHPQDSIILTALIYQYGNGIEDRRLNPEQVYSYRFSPTQDEGLYCSKTAWNDYWVKAQEKNEEAGVVLYCDIADFYNQIYHHTVENQLIESGFPNQGLKWIIKLLESTTANVSRGVPIGPHAIHLIAESSLIPIDNSMNSHGLDFIRYADDILIFVNSTKEAKSALSLMATILDKQQRLMLQRHKTSINNSSDFRSLCSSMIEDRPISTKERNLLGIIRKYTGGDPYSCITYASIESKDWAKFTERSLRKIINEYLSKTDVDYVRLRWFYRRLVQIGHPGALNVSLENIEALGPCLASICTYISSVQSIEPDDWKTIGSKLISLLDSEEIINNEFFRLSILSLFTKNKYINHFTTLVSRFQSSDSFARREILLAANENEAVDWLREHKETFNQMDPWQQMAFLYCVADFPADEKKYFINSLELKEPFDKTLAKWSKVK